MARSAAWPILLIAFGAALAFAALMADYFGTGSFREWGMAQSAALALGAVALAVGVALDVAQGRHTRAQTAAFWATTAQASLLVLVCNLYQVENRAFYEFVAPLAVAGMVVNHYLQPGWRMPFFLCISLGALFGVFGVSDPPTFLWLLVASLGMIGICHLPVPVWLRIALLAAAAAALAWARSAQLGWAVAALPVLASMLMFRLAIYWYDTAHGKGPTGLWHRLAYFFMLPNPVFPFFPVVDYTTFGRTYYNEEANRIYRRGVVWLTRGVVHLLLYRVVNLYILLPPEQVVDFVTFVQFTAANFALYLRISGLFHVIVGMLLLFGFNLPETHSRYFLAASFIDFWRRINIYWKDFMQKMVFTPVFLQLKKLGASHMAGVAVAISVVFIATWALHAYQWYWLRGTVLLTAPDVLFWAILAVLLLAQTFNEARVQRAPKRQSYLLSPAGFGVVRTACTFCVIALLWSLWTSESLSAWFAMLAAAGVLPAAAAPATAGAAQWAVSLASVAVVGVMTAAALGFSFGLAPPADSSRDQRERLKHAGRESMRARAVAAVSMLAALLVLQAPQLGRVLGSEAEELVASISETRLSRRDQALLERGYYESLTNVNNFSSRLWEIYLGRPNADTNIRDMLGTRLRDDYLEYDYQPASSAEYMGATYVINRWGLRDKDYSLEKPAGTYRIALLGASRASGYGVDYADRFETLLEEQLNAKASGHGGKKIEILNFAVDGYVPVQNLLTLEEKVWQFAPDMILYVGGVRERDIHREVHMLREGVPVPYDFLESIYREAGIERSMSSAEIERRLLPRQYDVAGAVYRRVVELAKARNVPAVWVLLPEVIEHDPARHEELGLMELRNRAAQAGFTVIDLSAVFDKRDVAQLRLADWDNHPNPAGHRVIADALVEPLRALVDGGGR